MAKNKAEEKNTTQKAVANIVSAKKEMGLLGFLSTAVGIIAVIAIAVVFFINNSRQKKNESAHDELFQAQYYFEKDSLNLAMNGDGRNLGFLSIIDIYGSTDAANLAHFYAGSVYLKQGNFQEALNHLNDFSSSEVLLQARADVLKGDAYMEQGQYSSAAREYERAANAIDDKFFSPGYLLKAALAHENNGDMTAALEAVTKIVNDYFGASQYDEAKKQKARLEILAAR